MFVNLVLMILYHLLREIVHCSLVVVVERDLVLEVRVIKICDDESEEIVTCVSTCELQRQSNKAI